MLAPMTCTIPLADLIKIRPNLWEKVVEFPKVGEFCKKHNIETSDIQRKPNTKKRKPILVPINKVSLQANENELENTTLLDEFNDCNVIAILDTRARAGIATKSIWKKWEKLALRRTRMQLQLMDGTLAKPLGMLERITITSCGISFMHTFPIVDFGRDPVYKVILG